jgi:excisionase family DNA binding protein
LSRTARNHGNPSTPGSRLSRPVGTDGEGFPPTFLLRAVPSPSAPGDAGTPLEQLLTVRQVATALQMSTSTVYRLAERGQLAHHVLNGSIRVARADMQAFLDRAHTRG